MIHLTRPFTSLAVAVALLLTTQAVKAAEAVEQHNSNAIWFENWIGLNNASLRVVAPDGQITDIFAASGTPVFQLSGSEVLDGVYSYELNAATEERISIVNKVDNGRGNAARDDLATPYNLSGSFTVSRGVIVTPEILIENEG